MWVFKKNGDLETYEVGYYEPLASDGTGGDFIILYDYAEQVDAAQKTHFLNGGN